MFFKTSIQRTYITLVNEKTGSLLRKAPLHHYILCMSPIATGRNAHVSDSPEMRTQPPGRTGGFSAKGERIIRDSRGAYFMLWTQSQNTDLFFTVNYRKEDVNITGPGWGISSSLLQMLINITKH